jgi:site-specific recombinase XerD
LPRAVDTDDVRQLLAVIDHSRDRAMILLLLRSGMRIGELLNLKVIDVNLREQKVMIYKADKTQVGRVVYFSEDAGEALEAWHKEREPRKEFLFYGQGRNRLTYTGARLRFTRYLRKADLEHKNYTIHCLRHTFATELLNAGLRLECLQQLLGHTNLEVTRRYARLSDNTREKEYFRAMSIIERNEIDEHHELDGELAALLEEEELLAAHSKKLPERP